MWVWVWVWVWVCLFVCHNFTRPKLKFVEMFFKILLRTLGKDQIKHFGLFTHFDICCMEDGIRENGDQNIFFFTWSYKKRSVYVLPRSVSQHIKGILQKVNQQNLLFQSQSKQKYWSSSEVEIIQKVSRRQRHNKTTPFSYWFYQNPTF